MSGTSIIAQISMSLTHCGIYGYSKRYQNLGNEIVNDFGLHLSEIKLCETTKSLIQLNQHLRFWFCSHIQTAKAHVNPCKFTAFS